MLIALEGVDGCGKSTLARNLSLVLGAEVLHCSKETPNNFNFFAQIIAEATSRNIIADRFMYGQFVYQTAIERAANGWLDRPDLSKLNRMMGATKARVIHVTAPVPVIKRRLQERNETIINGMSVEGVMYSFDSILREAAMFTSVIELSTMDYDWKRTLLSDIA